MLPQFQHKAQSFWKPCIFVHSITQGYSGPLGCQKGCELEPGTEGTAHVCERWWLRGGIFSLPGSHKPCGPRNMRLHEHRLLAASANKLILKLKNVLPPSLLLLLLRVEEAHGAGAAALSSHATPAAGAALLHPTCLSRGPGEQPRFSWRSEHAHTHGKAKMTPSPSYPPRVTAAPQQRVQSAEQDRTDQGRNSLAALWKIHSIFYELLSTQPCWAMILEL